MDAQSARKIIKKTEKDYDAIAKEWDKSRDLAKPHQIRNIKGIKKGEKVLDVGCGNAVLYDILAEKSIDYKGIDISQKLLNVAKRRIAKFKKNGEKIILKKSDITDIHFSKDKFDWVLALAVLHHVPSRELQEKAVQEIYRVLKPKGKTIVSVWNLYSDYAEKKFKIKEQLKNLLASYSQNDLVIPWKATPKKIYRRFIYRFDKKELFFLFKKAGFKKIIIAYRDFKGNKVKSLKKGSNITVTAQK